jgi:hypothetical protein
VYKEWRPKSAAGYFMDMIIDYNIPINSSINLSYQILYSVDW